MELNLITAAQQTVIAVSETITTPGPDLEFGWSIASLAALIVFILTTAHLISV